MRVKTRGMDALRVPLLWHGTLLRYASGDPWIRNFALLSWVEINFFCEGPNRFTTISWCFACCESMLRPEAPTEKPPKLQTSFWAWCGCGRPSLCLVHMIIWFICNFVYTSHGPRTYTDSDSLAQGSSGKFMSQSVSTMTVQWYEPTHLPWLRKITVYVLIKFCLNQ